MDTQSISQRPLVSFVIPAYNLPPDLLRACIGSIGALGLPPDSHEVIIVDDGSETPVSETFPAAPHHLKLLRQAHRGPSAARNNGLDHARGEYIQFVDGDDLLIERPYRAILDLLRRERPDMVVFRHTTDASNGGAGFDREPCRAGRDYMRTHNLRASVCGYVFSRERLGSLRFDTTLLTEEDEDFTPRLTLQTERLIATTAIPYYYRRRAGSTTNTFDAAHCRRRLDDMERIAGRLDKMSDEAAAADRPALRRRTAQLTADTIVMTIRLTRDYRTLRATLERLRGKGLLPLPSCNYNWKYTAFRLLIACPPARRILFLLLSRNAPGA